VTAILGFVLLLAGVFIMAVSRRIGAIDEDATTPRGLAVFLAGCIVVAVGAVLITGWWRNLSA
jgi:drug/metabolite transporter (DMT)-like permease